MNTLATKKTASKLINCTLSTLIGKKVEGIRAQVRNPRYLSAETPQLWRTMKEVRTYRENGKHWIELTWIKEDGDTCNYTGCTLESDSCMIQITPEELSKMNQQSR